MASVVKVALTGDFPVLGHGRSGTITPFIIAPGEGQDRTSGLTRSHARMLSATAGLANRILCIQKVLMRKGYLGISTLWTELSLTDYRLSS